MGKLFSPGCPMLLAYAVEGPRLIALPAADLAAALWIDLEYPTPQETAAVQALGPEIPSLADMEEIELSNRLYRQDGRTYLTVLLNGETASGQQASGPVTFILTPERLISVRHHRPRPFHSWPGHPDLPENAVCRPFDILLGLAREIIGRQADLLEGVGKSLDLAGREVFEPRIETRITRLRDLLQRIAAENERIGRVRLGLLTLDRALGFLEAGPKSADPALAEAMGALRRDITALEVHADFLTARTEMASDLTLGMINIGQTQTTKTVSVVAVIFMPPTLIASIYGMNFDLMPELHWRFGYPATLLGMVASAVLSWALFKWRRWL